MRSARRALWTLLLPALALLGGCRTRASQAAELAPDAAPVPPLKPSDGWVDGSPHLSEAVDLDGMHLNYLDWGGIGPALVMIHGLGGNPHIFDELAPLLRDHLHVLAYASRGHGDSDAPAKGPYDLKALVGDLVRLLDHLRIERANLLGWSTGGNELTCASHGRGARARGQARLPRRRLRLVRPDVPRGVRQDARGEQRREVRPPIARRLPRVVLGDLARPPAVVGPA